MAIRRQSYYFKIEIFSIIAMKPFKCYVTHFLEMIPYFKYVLVYVLRRLDGRTEPQHRRLVGRGTSTIRHRHGVHTERRHVSNVHVNNWEEGEEEIDRGWQWRATITKVWTGYIESSGVGVKRERGRELGKYFSGLFFFWYRNNLFPDTGIIYVGSSSVLRSLCVKSWPLL